MEILAVELGLVAATVVLALGRAIYVMTPFHKW